MRSRRRDSAILTALGVGDLFGDPSDPRQAGQSRPGEDLSDVVQCGDQLFDSVKRRVGLPVQQDAPVVLGETSTPGSWIRSSSARNSAGIEVSRRGLLRTRSGTLTLVINADRILRIFRITGLARVLAPYPWTACLAPIGLVMGGVAKNITETLTTSKGVADVFTRLGGGSVMVNAYFAATTTLFGLMASGYAIQAALKLRSEEANGRAEPLLATATGRVRWAASHLTLSVNLTVHPQPEGARDRVHGGSARVADPDRRGSHGNRAHRAAPPRHFRLIAARGS